MDPEVPVNAEDPPPPAAPAGRVAAIHLLAKGSCIVVRPDRSAVYHPWHHRFQDEVRVRRLIAFSRVCDGSPGPTAYSTCRTSLRATEERANQPNLAIRATPSSTATYFRRAWRS